MERNMPVIWPISIAVSMIRRSHNIISLLLN